jgi:hypothetical protein
MHSIDLDHYSPFIESSVCRLADGLIGIGSIRESTHARRISKAVWKLPIGSIIRIIS